jgi:hypothetical protein
MQLLKQVTVEVASVLVSLCNPSIDVLPKCCEDVVVWEQLPVFAVMRKLRNTRRSLPLIALQTLAVVISGGRLYASIAMLAVHTCVIFRSDRWDGRSFMHVAHQHIVC